MTYSRPLLLAPYVNIILHESYSSSIFERTMSTLKGIKPGTLDIVSNVSKPLDSLDQRTQLKYLTFVSTDSKIMFERY